MRSFAVALRVACLWLLIAAPRALAVAGGGVGHFGGGGGGGSGVHVNGSGNSGSNPPWWFLVPFALIVIVASAWVPARWSLRRRRQMRAARAAASEAALE